MIRRVLLAWMLLAGTASAQIMAPSPQGLTVQFSSTCAASTCATWAVGTATSVTVSVAGAGSWTGTFKASSDGGNTYFDATMTRLSDRSAQTTATDTGDGQYAIVNTGITHLQFRLTTWASGGANVWAIRGYGSTEPLPFSSGSPVPATSGGTGLSSYAVGDLLTANTTTTLARLADVAVGSVLVSGGVGVIPAWSANVAVTGTVAGGGLTANGGVGAPVVVAGPTGRVTGQTAAVAAVATYAVGASDGTFEVSSNVNVTTSTTHSFSVTVAYTDETNAARTLTLGYYGASGNFNALPITNVTGAGPYVGIPGHIRAKAATTITIATSGTFTTVTYNVEGYIRKMG